MTNSSRFCSAARGLRSLTLVTCLIAPILVIAGPAMASTNVTNVTSYDCSVPYCGIGESIRIQVTFSGTVTVTGIPKLALNSGGIAGYSGALSGNTLQFVYVIGTGQSSAHLDYTSTGALTLNGGSILDSTTNPAVLTLPAPGAPGSLGANTSIVVNTSGACALPELPAAVEYVISGTRILEFDQFGDFILQFGGTGSGPGQFQLPSGIWANNVGNLYVTDAVLNRVQKFDSCGHLVLQFGTTGTAPGFLDGPYGVTVDSFGYIWVADTGNNRVQAFDYTGAFVTQIGGLGGGNGQFDAPVGITVNATALQIASGESTLFVADTGSNRIQEFNITYSPSPAYFPSVAFNLKFGSHGNGNGQFNGPFGIVTDGVSVWVADSFNQRIQQFSVAGVFVQTFGGPFSYASPFGVGLPFGGIAVGLWAVDYNLNTVTLYSSAGAVILTFGVTGGGPGQLFHPTYIACGLNASQV